jgi:effector-binding domain-containing protein
LDQIIILRDLGFSLDQIRDLQQHHITEEQIWKILAQRREAIIQNVKEEIARLRQLEARLEQFAHRGDFPAHRVVVKQVEEQPYLYAASANDADHHTQFNGVYAARHEIKTRKTLMTVLHDTRASHPYEVGYVVDRRVRSGQVLSGGIEMTLRTLPAVEQMACLVYSGQWDDSHAATGALGLWLEQNDRRIVGPFRQVFLQMSDPAVDARAVVELQIPIASK